MSGCLYLGNPINLYEKIGVMVFLFRPNHRKKFRQTAEKIFAKLPKKLYFRVKLVILYMNDVRRRYCDETI